MVFAKDAVEGSWKWRGYFANVSKYTYLGIDFNYGTWDAHIKRVVDGGRKKVNQLHSVII